VDGVAQVRTVESFVPNGQAEKLPVVAAIGEEFRSIESRIRRNPTTDDLADGARKLQRSANLLAAASAAAGLASLQSAAIELSGALADYQTSSEASRLQALNRALAGGLPSLFDQLRRNVRPVTLDDMPPEFRRDWLAPDGTARIQVTPAVDVTDGDKLEAFSARVQAVAPAATGVPIMISGAATVVRQSFAQAVVITAIAIIAIIALVRRRLADVVLILTPLVLASVWTVGAAAVLGLTFNFANVIVIPVLLGVGVASSIHVVSRAREMDTPGAAGGPGFLDSSTPRAVLLTDANTALAFATLALVPSRIVQPGGPARTRHHVVAGRLADRAACHSDIARAKARCGAQTG
jgi:predicted RND superfamily exporter protein